MTRQQQMAVPPQQTQSLRPPLPKGPPPVLRSTDGREQQQAASAAAEALAIAQLKQRLMEVLPGILADHLHHRTSEVAERLIDEDDGTLGETSTLSRSRGMRCP